MLHWTQYTVLSTAFHQNERMHVRLGLSLSNVWLMSSWGLCFVIGHAQLHEFIYYGRPDSDIGNYRLFIYLHDLAENWPERCRRVPGRHP